MDKIEELQLKIYNLEGIINLKNKSIKDMEYLCDKQHELLENYMPAESVYDCESEVHALIYGSIALAVGRNLSNIRRNKMYQKCPLCNGTGIDQVSAFTGGGATCLVCHGKKIINSSTGFPPNQETTKQEIMGGDYSRDMWEAINSSKTVEDLKDALYLVCCRLQELETKYDDPERFKKFMEKTREDISIMEATNKSTYSEGLWFCGSCNSRWTNKNEADRCCKLDVEE